MSEKHTAAKDGTCQNNQDKLTQPYIHPQLPDLLPPLADDAVIPAPLYEPPAPVIPPPDQKTTLPPISTVLSLDTPPATPPTPTTPTSATPPTPTTPPSAQHSGISLGLERIGRAARPDVVPDFFSIKILSQPMYAYMYNL